MEHISDLFGKMHVSLETKSRKTERGELLKYFSGKMGKPIPWVAVKVEGLEVADLYYLKSICDKYEVEGKPFGKAFNGSLKVRHEAPVL